ncbi:MAG: hypothetical protein V3T14_07870 [Myxococcota bacterium]
MTFRIPPDLAAALHHLPNQTAFVETALRDALGRTCPVCHGTGEAPGAHLSVSNLKRVRSGRLDRESAAQLKTLVRLGRQLLATQLDLEPSGEEPGLGFRLARDNQVLLAGRIPGGRGQLKLTH